MVCLEWLCHLRKECLEWVNQERQVCRPEVVHVRKVCPVWVHAHLGCHPEVALPLIEVLHRVCPVNHLCVQEEVLLLIRVISLVIL